MGKYTLNILRKVARIKTCLYVCVTIYIVILLEARTRTI